MNLALNLLECLTTYSRIQCSGTSTVAMSHGTKHLAGQHREFTAITLASFPGPSEPYSGPGNQFAVGVAI
jgi:hypothetical protein